MTAAADQRTWLAEHLAALRLAERVAEAVSEFGEVTEQYDAHRRDCVACKRIPASAALMFTAEACEVGRGMHNQMRALDTSIHERTEAWRKARG